MRPLTARSILRSAYSVAIPISPKKQKALKYVSPIELRLLITNMKAILFDQLYVKRQTWIPDQMSKIPSKMGHFVFYTFFLRALDRSNNHSI